MPEITLRGARFHYQRLGAGPPVVFVHGLLMDNLSSWYFSVANAVAARADVLLYDLRGHGKSERTRTGYALDEMVLDLAALLDATVAGPVHLVGNSYGGMLALAFALQFPYRVSDLVLVDAHLGEMQGMLETLALQGEARDRRIAEAFKDWAARHSRRKRTRLAESAQSFLTDTSLLDDLARTPPMDLRGLDVPVVALYGEKSDLRALAEKTLRGLPRCTLRVLPDCSHSVLWERTDRVRDAILEVLP